MHRKLPLYIISTEEVKLYHVTLRRQANNTITSEHVAGKQLMSKPFQAYRSINLIQSILPLFYMFFSITTYFFKSSDIMHKLSSILTACFLSQVFIAILYFSNS
jgi:hypothetical protein